MPRTNGCQPTKVGSSVASPGCRRFRSRDDTSAIVTPRVALRSRSHERCEGAVTSDRDVCLDRHLEPDARGQRLRSRRRVTPGASCTSQNAGQYWTPITVNVQCRLTERLIGFQLAAHGCFLAVFAALQSEPGLTRSG